MSLSELPFPLQGLWCDVLGGVLGHPSPEGEGAKRRSTLAAITFQLACSVCAFSTVSKALYPVSSAGNFRVLSSIIISSLEPCKLLTCYRNREKTRSSHRE